MTSTLGRSPNAGFTLIEALLAMGLMGLILAALATVTSQWLPNWNRGFLRVQRNELVTIAMDRIVADLNAVEYITPNRDTKFPLFEGAELSVIFVRSAIGPNAKPGLEIVRIAEAGDRNGRVLVRSRAPFAPIGVGPVASPQVRLTDPVALLRAPYRVSFSYAGKDGLFKNTWLNANDLPSVIRITIRDAATERRLAISTAAMVHVEVPAESVCESSDKGCSEEKPPTERESDPEDSYGEKGAMETRTGRSRR
jgi:general secretion pathway protein J